MGKSSKVKCEMQFLVSHINGMKKKQNRIQNINPDGDHEALGKLVAWDKAISIIKENKEINRKNFIKKFKEDYYKYCYGREDIKESFDREARNIISIVLASQKAKPKAAPFSDKSDKEDHTIDCPYDGTKIQASRVKGSSIPDTLNATLKLKADQYSTAQKLDRLFAVMERGIVGSIDHAAVRVDTSRVEPNRAAYLDAIESTARIKRIVGTMGYNLIESLFRYGNHPSDIVKSIYGKSHSNHRFHINESIREVLTDLSKGHW